MAHAPPETCPHCGAPAFEIRRFCKTCQNDLGAPNVRLARAEDERRALKQRYEEVRSTASETGCLAYLDDFENRITAKSAVVVCVPASIAKSLVSDPREGYINYESLVGANARAPAAAPHDRARRGVSATLFGEAADHLAYGVLSLDNAGLPTYGDVYCVLKTLAISHRTSFLETNSFRFVNIHEITPTSPFPAGYRAAWENRHELAAAKHGTHIINDPSTDPQALLVQSDAVNRDNDEFIEAHIYEGFDIYAIEDMVPVRRTDRPEQDELDLKIALDKFAPPQE